LSRQNGKKIEGIQPEALAYLETYHWPGNVRELKNVLERMVVLSIDSILTAENVPEDLKKKSEVSISFPQGDNRISYDSNLQEMEKELIRVKLAESRGNKSAAAKKLGISRRTLYRKLDQYKISQ
jgi:DNA-binding NtrC family response regulator